MIHFVESDQLLKSPMLHPQHSRKILTDNSPSRRHVDTGALSAGFGHKRSVFHQRALRPPWSRLVLHSADPTQPEGRAMRQTLHQSKRRELGGTIRVLETGSSLQPHKTIFGADPLTIHCA